MDSKKKKSLEASYERIINVGFCIVPYEDLSDIIDINPVVFGTTKDEKIFSIEEVDALFKSQFEQMGNMKPALDRKRIATRISADGNHGFIVEEITLTLSSPEENNTIFMRASCVMEYMDSLWKLTHWHTSTPVDTENDHWHQEEWKREKEKLQKLVDQQTADLQGKNRELEIEAALERIRAQATAMQESSDLLDIVVTMRTEFVNLGHEAHYFWHMRWLPDHYKKAMTSGDGTKIGMVMTLPRHIHGDIEPVAEWEKSNEATHVLAMDVDTAVDYVDKMISLGDFEQVDPQAPTLDDIRHIGGLTFIMARTTHGEIGYSLPGVVPDPPKDAVDTLVRFAGVFDLAYKRFEDLKAAERQHREAQIELALERVRARTMAMQSSDEFADVAAVLFDQVRTLGGDLWGTGFGLCEEDADNDEFWFANENGVFPAVSIPNTEDPAHKKMYQGWKNKMEFLALEGSGEDLKSHYEYMMTLPEVRPFFQKILDEGLTFPEWQQWNAAYFSHGYLLIITLEPYSNKEILKRFARVFDQTYTRFLDLKKAEAQARESEIQLALERVRARSMAMHQSDELADLSLELVKQVHALGIDTWFCAFNIYDDHPEGSIEWGSNGQGTFPRYRTPREGVFLDYYEAGQRGETLLINEIGEDECPAHYDYLCSLSGVGEQLLKMKDEGIPFPAYQIDHAAFFRYGYILFITFEPVPEAHDIFKRFAKVFQQTYTRFLDLQKSEEQAREAKIEAALERVRARSMGMHKSDDLIDVVREIGKGIHELGIQLHYSQIYTDYTYDPKTGLNIWVDVEGRDYLEKFHLPYIDHSITFNFLNALNEGLDYFSDRYSKAEKDSYFKLLFKYSDLKRIPKKRKELILNASGWTRFTVILNEATLNFGRYSLDEFTDEEHEIFIRFAKVFGQAYTRFLDLEKAEAQAREAQIEASLERVRARSMAMQNSDELNDVLSVLFRQFDVLDIQPVTAFLSLIDIEKNTFTYRSTSKAGNRMQTQQVVDLDSLEIWKDLSEKWKNDKQDSIEVIYYPPEVIEELFGLLDETFSAMPEKERLTSSDFPGGGYAVHGYCKFGYLGYNHHRPPSDEEKEILIKFAKEFGRVYQRFLDIQKAEKQARESEIQLALERVRARTMAMHNSDELGEVASVLFEQISSLTTTPDRFNIAIANEAEDSFDIFITDQDGVEIKNGFKADIKGSPVLSEAFEDWKNDAPHLIQDIHGKELENWIRYMGDIVGIPFNMEQVKDHRFLSSVFFSHGFIGITTHEEPDSEIIHLLERFSKVFQQTYVRFLDLQKAEEQAREAKIETALEKVRSRTMGMQSSEELPKVANLLFLEVQALGIPAWSCGYNILNEDKKSARAWMSSEGTLQDPFTLRLYGEASFDEMGDFVISNDNMLVQEVGGEALQEHYKHMKSFPDLLPTFETIEKEGLSLPTYQINHLCRFSHGFLLFITYEPVPDAHDIFKRFTNVFDQTYTRFLDLQKAEEQAREAQIGNALEKVRSRSLAMQDPDELIEIAQLLREEMGALGVEELETSSIYIYDEDSSLIHCWFTIKDAEDPGKTVADQMTINLQDTWVGRQMHEFYSSDKDSTSILMKGDHRIEWIRYCEEKSDLFGKSEFYGETIPERTYHLYKFSNGFLGAASPGNISDESWDLMRRATGVFSFAYTRFSDLQKAEEQAREAEIEASLERVRAKGLAMHSTEEIESATAVVFNELSRLGIDMERCGITIMNETPIAELWSTTLSQETKEVIDIVTGHLDFRIHPLTQQSYQDWKEKKKYSSYYLVGDELQKYYDKLEKQPEYKFPKAANYPDQQVLHSFFFSEGAIFIYTTTELPAEAKKILHRFTIVFEQTYTRFLDIQRAEKLAIETARQSSLDRIRAEIASMRSADDLNQITPIIWDELKTLDIPFIRCGVFLMDKENNLSHTYLSTAQGEPIAALHLPLKGIPLVENLMKSWKENEIYTVHWDEDNFMEWTQNLINRGFIDSKTKYEAGSAPTTLDLHFLPFKHGMLYIGNTESLSKENLDLGQSIANAFSVAYDRYEDFNNLEQAKKKIEEAYKELEAAKDQLVQQEKLASLGQLTAGIAHEIKNPLNFVNNFSELSVELVEEARDEIRDLRREINGERSNVKREKSPFEGGAEALAEAGDVKDSDDDIELLFDILDDIEANLKTIHKHGSRADSIVKSMLEHSRGGSGKMEPTDLNGLVKEFVNLSFHGMRAGKHPINVDIDMQLDDSIGEVMLIAEDFSRVIVNLCNNAFDAMREKLDKTLQGFETLGGLDEYRPKLTVRTKHSNSNIAIEIEDNGPGITEEMKDKILQPFFTTKKGTQGTGLGLSITNDIVKVHGGSLNVHSKPGQTVFMITLTV